MLRIENLLLRGDGQVTQGRMLEETSLVQGPAAENGARGGANGSTGTNGASGGGGGQGAVAPTGGAVPNGVAGLRDGSCETGSGGKLWGGVSLVTIFVRFFTGSGFFSHRSLRISGRGR